VGAGAESRAAAARAAVLDRPPLAFGSLRGRCGALLLLAVALPLGALAVHCARSPEIPFVAPGPRAPWVMAPRPVSAALEQWGRVEVPVTSFERRFERSGDAPLRLRVRALRGFTLFMNATEVARDDGADWRTPREVDATPWLRPGANEIRIEVARAAGPALVEVRSEGAPGLETGPEWHVRIDGEPLGAAIPADDTRRNPNALAVETPLEGARRAAGVLAGLFALGAGGWLLANRAGAGRLAALPGAALAVAAGGWALLFAAKAARIPAAIGFDARHHLYYAAWIREKASLPLATDGWSTYHPPLFHALSALVLPASGEPVGAALKLLPFVGGFAAVVASFLLARRLLAGDPPAQLLAVGFAAVLPVNLYSAAYFSNEPLHAGLAGLALWLGVEAMLAPRLGPGRLAALGLALGLAALTKFTALLLLPAATLAVAARRFSIDRAGLARAGAAAGALLGLVALVAGWFYARSWLLLGDPLVGNWNLPGADQRWWQQPGFHTPAYYARFGEALVHPYLAGFRSFWDALYSTFWGDGFIAGRTDPARRHAFWSYEFMSAGYLAAFPATGVVLAGAVRAMGLAVADPDPRRRLAHAFLLLAAWSVALAFLALTLRLPFFAQAKAAYLLPLAPACALWFALGARSLDALLARRGLEAARAALAGLWTLAAGTLFLAFAA
jgi:hypothetical protein